MLISQDLYLLTKPPLILKILISLSFKVVCMTQAFQE